jgi:glutamine amidotransferase
MSHKAYSHMQGGTDTEHFAALFMTKLTANDQSSEEKHLISSQESVPSSWIQHHTTQQLKKALEETIHEVIAIQSDIMGKEVEASSLNIAITDGKSLVACRYRNHSTEQPPSLYVSTTAGVTLNRQFPDHPDGGKGDHGVATVSGEVQGHNPNAHRCNEAHGKHVIIASEPSTYRIQDWTLVKKNHMVLVHSSGEMESVKMMSD